MCEAHLPQSAIEGDLRRLRAAVWRGAIAPSQEVPNTSVARAEEADAAGQAGDDSLCFAPGRRTKRLTRGEGGTVALLRSHLSSEPLRLLEDAGASGLIQDVSGIIWRLRATALVFAMRLYAPLDQS